MKKRKIDLIVVHHTCTPKTATLEQIRAFHIEKRGFVDIGYHFLIDDAGVIYEGRPLQRTGAHCKNHNQRSIGIAAIGNYQIEDVSPDLEGAVLSLVEWLRVQYPGAAVKAHRDLSNTLCPGDFLYRRMKGWILQASEPPKV